MREINKQLASDEKKYGNHIWAQMQYKVDEKRLDKLNRATSRAEWSKAREESKRIVKEKYSIQCLK